MCKCYCTNGVLYLIIVLYSITDEQNSKDMLYFTGDIM